MTRVSVRRPIILVHLMGGLGNQMFQYAFGRGMALRSQGQLLLDTSGYGAEAFPDSGNAARVVGLSHFRISGDLTDDPYSESALRLPVRRWIRKAKALAAGLADQRKPYFLRQQIVEPAEQRFRFDRRLANTTVRGCVSVRGFWQSEAYFRDIEEQIRNELALREEPRGKNAEFAASIAAANAVAIHVRHGDNATGIAPELGVLPHEYYVHALGMMLTELKSPTFFVFSDDAAWSRHVIPPVAPLTFVEHNGALDSHEDMRLMMLCKHHILANSTFGWWGAWLAKTPGQIVIAPRRYYLGRDRPNPDLYPPAWRLL